ncbi:MAG: hypothetical protein H0Z28_13445 [Archaeoglobus sp.]|nr:hypothetical protein [Archaeoglobus sp.]
MTLPMKRCLIFILLIILVFGTVFSGCSKQESPSNAPNAPTPKIKTTSSIEEEQKIVKETPSYERRNLTLFKGVWPSPGTTGKALANDVEKMREDGVNAVCISPVYIILSDGSLKSVGESPEWEGHAEELYIEYIRKAHDAGLAVYLTIDPVPVNANPWHIEPLSGERKEKFIEEVTRVVIHWAEIAEKEKVELFSPMNEPETFLGSEDGVKWSENILPKVKEKFRGDVIVKFADIGPRDLENYGDLTGYDYLAIDVYDNNPKELKERLRAEVIPRAKSLAEKYGMKGFVFGEMGGDVKDKKVLAEILDVFFNESWNYSKGYFVSGWGKNPDPSDPSDCTFTDTPAEDIVRKWFLKIEA